MKRLLLLLFPLSLFSQSFYELKLIDSLDDFKKVMIENRYQFDKIEDDGQVVYGFGLVKDSIDGSKSEKWGSYDKDGSWGLQFSDRKTLIYKFGDYGDIVDEIKMKCDYVNIVNYRDWDYVTYKCEDSKFDGKLGFLITDDTGYIRYFPPTTE